MESITNKYLKSLFNSIGNDLKLLIKKAENRPYTTQNNYGAYMDLLTMLKPQLGLDNAVKLLILAGGNKLGIKQAKQILK
jgi:hypothetical protein